MGDFVLEVSNLNKSFNSEPVLKGVELSLSKGEIVVVIGPSGSGKTTLLRCINLLEIPDSGTIKLTKQVIFENGRHIKALNLSDVRQRIGMVFQQLNLWPHKSVLDNIALAPVATGKLNKHDAYKKTCKLLEEMKLLLKKDEYIGNLSGGQQQRVAICRALVMDPEVVLLDEITSALDPEIVGDILEVIESIARKGQTMIIVTHEMIFARDVADRILFLDEGKFIEEGAPEDILMYPKKPRTKEFLSRVIYSKQIKARI
jgi:polar amino acid transport system ATP-binding protein